MSLDTICALATPTGRSALAVIRISGPNARPILEKATGKSFEVRKATKALFKDHQGEVLDEVVATYFQAPASYTGEDLVEIATHGNPFIVERILRSIVSRETRLAEPGEFTRRALAYGKLTLNQVEALGVLLSTSSVAGVSRALRAKLEGVSSFTEKIGRDLTNLLVLIQSQLDFPENEVGEYSQDQIRKAIEAQLFVLQSWADDFQKHRALLESPVVVLAGPPNAGKSSLFNALLNYEKAIVFNEPGTTRDYLVSTLELDGVGLTLIDTAGFRLNPEPIEKLGIEKSIEMMRKADLLCWVSEKEDIPQELRSQVPQKSWLLIQSKSDLGLNANFSPSLNVSVFTSDGLEALKLRLRGLVAAESSAEVPSPLISKRQFECSEQARAALVRGLKLLLEGQALDLVAEEVGQSQKALEDLVGKQAPDGLLREIFARFCIGK